VVVHSEGGGVKVDDLRKRTATVRSKTGVEAAACSGVGNEAAMLSRAGIKDDRWRWRWRRDGF
jgi:hypothetical protein